MRDASSMVARAAPGPGWHAARLLLFALAGYVATDLPAWLHGAHIGWMWGAFSALACALVAGLQGGLRGGPARRWPRCRGSDAAMLACMAAISGGMALDFLRVPPESLLSLCSSAAGMGVPALLAHVRWFPLTMLAMLVLIWLPYLPRMQRAHGNGGLPGVALRMLADAAAMLMVMALWMNAGKAIAALPGWPWAANGMVSLMLTGMLAFAWLHAAVATLFLRRWQPALALNPACGDRTSLPPSSPHR